MKCLKCNNTPYFNQLCRKHFCEQIEKRIRKEMRLTGCLSKGDIILAEDEISRYFLESIARKLPIKIVSSGKHTKKAIPWTMDDEIGYFVKKFIEGKDYTELWRGDEIKLFRTVKNEELRMFAKAKDLVFEKEDDAFVKGLMDKMEEKHKETRFSLLKSIEAIEKALKN